MVWGISVEMNLAWSPIIYRFIITQQAPSLFTAGFALIVTVNILINDKKKMWHALRIKSSQSVVVKIPVKSRGNSYITTLYLV